RRRKAGGNGAGPNKRRPKKKESDYEDEFSDESNEDGVHQQAAAANQMEVLIPHDDLDPPSKLPEDLLATLEKTPGQMLLAGMYRYVASGPSAAHTIVVNMDRKALGFGRNPSGQLGLSQDIKLAEKPTLIPALEQLNVVQAAVGRHHTLFLTDTGTVYACGENNLHTFGLPEYGQLGHNTDAKYFVNANKLSFHFETSPKKVVLYIEKSKEGHVTPVDGVQIVDFACGNNHTVAIDSKKRVYSWGFGGFGRLGHAEPKDEMVPRLMKFFDTQGRGGRSVYCGSTFSLINKKTGEANMYPKPVQDLSGWNITDIGCANTSIMISADDTLIAWGASPTFGELGIGEFQKSSTVPKEVPKLDNMKIPQSTDQADSRSNRVGDGFCRGIEIMNRDNLQQWWENSYRRHHQEPSHGLDSAELLFSLQEPNQLRSDQVAYDQDFDYGNFSLENPYGLVVFGGVVGNSTLVLTLCSASSVRLRNPLLLAVCVADLLVTGISAPVTLLNLAMSRRTRSLPLVLCKVIHYIQVMPVAASTISFFMLSLDRYATVKHPRLAQLRQRRYLHVSLALLSWLASAAISTPFLSTMGKGGVASTTPSPISISCTSDLGANAMFMSFILFHTIAVFVLPGVGVLLNHYGTHMVIVTGCPNAQQAACGGATTGDDTSNGNGTGTGGGPMAVSPGDIQLHTLHPRQPGSIGSALEPGSYRSSNPISPREIRAHSQRQRINRSGKGPATPGIPLPQTSTLRSRRHLANMLIASAVIFIACWAPHVFCIFYKSLGSKQHCSQTSVYFSLLLGYFYSAISPVIYWALNHNSLRQSPCAPIIRLRSMQNFLRSRFRTHTAPPPPSSTNEAALGAFNPKLIKLTPKQYRAQASSHYLY
ncbi:hypothetical protein M5D96_008951, partial [Drosophila gunungcola]